jgi:hypothetical protein
VPAIVISTRQGRLKGVPARVSRQASGVCERRRWAVDRSLISALRSIATAGYLYGELASNGKERPDGSYFVVRTSPLAPTLDKALWSANSNYQKARKTFESTQEHNGEEKLLETWHCAWRAEDALQRAYMKLK